MTEDYASFMLSQGDKLILLPILRYEFTKLFDVAILIEKDELGILSKREIRKFELLLERPPNMWQILSKATETQRHRELFSIHFSTSL